MTPLAHRIVNRLTLLPAKREPMRDDDRMLASMDGIHCFELTAVFPLIEDLAERLFIDSYAKGCFDPTLAFLPAPKTWIEFSKNGKRDGFLLLAGDHILASTCQLFVAHGGRDGVIAARSGFLQLLNPSPSWTVTAGPKDQTEFGEHVRIQFYIYAALALINSPKIIGRKQHMPNRGLEREMTRAMGVGKFPLLAWTEIKLRVSPPKFSEDDIEAHLTGRKALHFCRAHLRIKMGRLEYVSAHWRGDPALGIKRSRYSVSH